LIFVTVTGILKLVKLEHLQKAVLPILVTPLGIVKLPVRPDELEKKAPSPIETKL
jgi:S-adenosylhomocysteine hydrolase